MYKKERGKGIFVQSDGELAHRHTRSSPYGHQSTDTNKRDSRKLTGKPAALPVGGVGGGSGAVLDIHLRTEPVFGSRVYCGGDGGVRRRRLAMATTLIGWVERLGILAAA